MAKKLFRVETEKIENGEELFLGNDNLISWEGNLTSLKDGYSMFQQCENLKSFSGDIGSENCSANGYRMFNNCTNLESVKSDIIRVGNAWAMFWCDSLKTFDVKKLIIEARAWSVFSSLAPIETLEFDELQISDANGTFGGCENLKSIVSSKGGFSGSGAYAFDGCISLQNVVIDLSSLTIGEGMFEGCKKLRQLPTTYTNLKYADYMFYDCEIGDVSFNFPNLIEAKGMFNNSGIMSFRCSTPNLINGVKMFCDNQNFTTFEGDLSSLVSGYKMFKNTLLSADSIVNICNSLPNVKDKVHKTVDIKKLCDEQVYEYIDYDPQTQPFFVYESYYTIAHRNDVVGGDGEDGGSYVIHKPLVNLITLESDESFSLGEIRSVSSAIGECAQNKGWSILTKQGLTDWEWNINIDVPVAWGGYLLNGNIVDGNDEYIGRMLHSAQEAGTFDADFSKDGYGGFYEGDINQFIDGLKYGDFVDYEAFPISIELLSGEVFLGECIILEGTDKCLVNPTANGWQHCDSIESVENYLQYLEATRILNVVEGSPYIPDASYWNDNVNGTHVLDNVASMKVENGFVWVEEE